MKLYENKELFTDLLERTSRHFNIRLSLVEKDYFIYLFLKKAKELVPGLVFKGGTSLSKCYKIVNRFSEDIDLTLDLDHFSQKYKRGSLKTLIELANIEPFTLINKNERLEHSHANYNFFNINYKRVYKDETALPVIKMEMVYITKCYPYQKQSFISYIGEYLLTLNRLDLIKDYELDEFDLQVQTLERTFIDKVFAICDYFERNESYRNSRHIYDLYKIYPQISIKNNGFLNLINEVRNDRKKGKYSLSAQQDYNINKTLQKIRDSNYFERDYDEVTMNLLYTNEDYKTVIEVLDKIIDSKVF